MQPPRRSALHLHVLRSLPLILAASVGLGAGCHNTAQGVKQDTKRALEKTGEKLQKAGKKIKDDK